MKFPIRLISACLFASFFSHAADKATWTEILEAPAPTSAAPGDTSTPIEWHSDLPAALEEAEKSGKPLLITFRCLPCKQCAAFDKTVLEGTPLLDPALSQFVTVRVTDAAQLDDRLFPYTTHQDLDLSWWAYFFSPKGELYGVFGGKDHVSDETRISEKAFLNNMNAVLAHHHNPKRRSWKIDGPVPDFSANQTGPKDRKGHDLLHEMRPGMAEHQTCLHCHQVGDILNLELIDAGDFKKNELKDRWPLPENVGIILDRDLGNVIKMVELSGPAANAGMKAGDVIGMADQTRIFGQADLRGALHRASARDESILIGWTSNGEAKFASLAVKTGWKAEENWWRKSVYDGVYGPGMGFFPLKGPNFGKGKGLSVRPWMGKQPAQKEVYSTGLRPNMEIVAINGMRDDKDIRKLITWFRFNHKVGDKVTYTVRVKGGLEKDFSFTLPAK